MLPRAKHMLSLANPRWRPFNFPAAVGISTPSAGILAARITRLQPRCIAVRVKSTGPADMPGNQVVWRRTVFPAAVNLNRSFRMAHLRRCFHRLCLDAAAPYRFKAFTAAVPVAGKAFCREEAAAFGIAAPASATLRAILGRGHPLKVSPTGHARPYHFYLPPSLVQTRGVSLLFYHLTEGGRAVYHRRMSTRMRVLTPR